MPKLSAFNKNENPKAKKFTIIAPVVLAIVAIIIVSSSYAIFHKEEDALLINATVGDFAPESETISYVVDGEPADKAPDTKDYIVVVDCGTTAKATWDTESWSYTIEERKSRAVVCTIGFYTPTAGNEVVIGTEHFFVIANDVQKVTLLSKYNINLQTLTQYGADTPYSTYATAFSKSLYWNCPYFNTYCYEPDHTTYYNLNIATDNEDAIVVNTARSYGESLGVTGRLLTREELNKLVTTSGPFSTLQGDAKMLEIIGGTYTDQEHMRYWLGSTSTRDSVWIVNGLSVNHHLWSGGANFGVRPVIEIPKSSISVIPTIEVETQTIDE